MSPDGAFALSRGAAQPPPRQDMYIDAYQLAIALLLVFGASAVAAVLVFERSRPRAPLRAWGGWLLGAGAVLAVASWTGFGNFHAIFVDGAGVREGSSNRAKVESHVPFHFHEFFHYYLGAKYFREIGYGALYDCTAFADAEIAEEDGVPRKITGYVRNLDDVLRDKTHDEALSHCRTEVRPRFSDARWASFKNDQRELRRLVPDGWWEGATYDAGFNPPPSWIVIGTAFANLIPIRLAGAPTYLLATGLDLALLLACFVVLHARFGAATAALAAIFFGANFIASFGWNGGAFLRYTWITAIVFALAAAKGRRWVLAGALFGAAACDRIFPIGFAVGAAIPLVYEAIHAPEKRVRVLRLAGGFAASVVVLVLASSALFGLESWRVFFTRIVAHGDVYYVMHIGLKKILTFHDWTASQNFHGHAGLERFHDWNLRLRDAWAAARPVAIPLQILAVVGATAACIRRKPYEASILFGIVAMFFLSLPANYYYVVLALVPALLFRSAATAPRRERRLLEYGAFVAFVGFWICSLVASRMWGDDIVYDHFICQALLVFLLTWMAAWTLPTVQAVPRDAPSSKPADGRGARTGATAP